MDSLYQGVSGIVAAVLFIGWDDSFSSIVVVKTKRTKDENKRFHSSLLVNDKTFSQHIRL